MARAPVLLALYTAAAAAAAAAAASDTLTLQVCSADDNYEGWALQSGGLVQSTINATQCVSGASGTPLIVAECEPSDPLQSWFFHASDGTVRSADNSTCWNVPGQSITPGTSVLAYPCGTPINRNLLFAYEPAARRIFANESGLCLRWDGAQPPPPPHVPAMLNVTSAPCFADNTGTTDATAAIQQCINLGYSTLPPTPLFFPAGTYLVSDTLAVVQTNPGPDDGINVVPARFLSHVLFGSTAALPARPTLRLAPTSPGFGDPGHYKPVVHIYNSGGEGVDMNNLFRGIDLDLTAPGNPGAAGISHPGAQGATVTDVTVRGGGAFACFAGVNGAGGMHSNVACYGARYGFYVDDSQPIGSIVGATLVNQSVSAVLHNGQEILSIVGTVIEQPANASGPAIVSPSQGFSIVDSSVSCGEASPSGASIAVSSQRSVYLQNTYVLGCKTAVSQPSGSLPGPGPASAGWQQVSEYARGIDPSPYMHANVIYKAGVRIDGGFVEDALILPPGQGPPSDLQSRHLWTESTFPSFESPTTADARRDCGAKGDNVTDDTAALQACIDGHRDVFLPSGRYRISATLQLRPGSRVVGISNTLSVIAAATTGFPAASPSSPQPMVQTSDADGDGGGDASATVLAFLGIVAFQHVPDVFTLDWRSRNPASVWRTGFESRDCECLWTSAWQHLNPPDVPCKPPVNATVPKSQFHGVGRIYSFVNDDTGGIISTAASYRHLLIADTGGGPDSRLRFYSLNLEHAQAEANAEASNASFVDIYSIKSEGNLPVLWIRGGSTNVSVLAFGGGICPFAYNYSYPPDHAQYTPSLYRIDAGCSGVKLATMLDHGYGAGPPFWPPKGGGCAWEHHYPYPGAAVPDYPFWTYPNVTMWNCWYGSTTSVQYWYTITDRSRGGTPTASFHSAPMDKPVYYMS